MNLRESTSRPLYGATANANLLPYLLSALLVYTLISLKASADGLEHYRLAADDVLSITVFGEPELTLNDARVAFDGSISFPLLGQIQVGGLTVGEVEAELSRRLADGYLRTPRVTVAITEYRLVYVNGEVKKPGGYSYRNGLTVHKAVTLAGGFTERASLRKITLIRENETGLPKKVNLSDRLRPGDIIIVGESFF